MNNNDFYTKANRRLDIIWNLTAICPWECTICCVDAKHVSYDKDSDSIRINDSKGTFKIKKTGNEDIFNEALQFLQSKKLELTFEEKCRVIDNIDYPNVKIDFSGGDALIVDENYKVLKYATKKFGRDNITITLTGGALARVEPETLKNLISELNFTYDFPRDDEDTRTKGYNASNLRQASKYVGMDVSLRAEMPLSTKHKNLDLLEEAYLDLHNAGVQKLLLMRLFPSGRATISNSDMLTKQDYNLIFSKLSKLENIYGYPKIKLQCALRHLAHDSLSLTDYENPCDAVANSFGLRWDGLFLASPWAIKRAGSILGEEWDLGYLHKNKLSELLTTSKANQFVDNRDSNIGHCKIFSFIFSLKKDNYARIFDVSDPIHTDNINTIESNLQRIK